MRLCKRNSHKAAYRKGLSLLLAGLVPLMGLTWSTAADAETAPTVSNVYIVGTETIEAKTLMPYVTGTQTGKPLDTKLLQADLDRLIASGMVDEVKAKIVPMGEGCTVFLHVTEAHEIKKVSVEGAKVSDKTTSLKQGDTLTHDKLKTETERINKELKDKGSLAEVTQVKFDGDGNVKFVVEEKIMSKVEFQGLKKTKEWLAKKLVSFLKPGKTLSKKDIDKALNKLTDSGYFDKVHAELVPDAKKGEFILRFVVTEPLSGEWRFGGGTSTRSGTFLTGSVKENNLHGEGKEVSAAIRYNPDDSEYSLRYRDNFYHQSNDSLALGLWKTHFKGTVDGSSYTEGTQGGSIYYEKALHDDPRFKFTTGVRMETQTVEENTTSRRDVLRVLSLGYIADTTDDTKNPTKGSIVDLKLDNGLKILGGTVSFEKFKSVIRHYMPLDEKGKTSLAFRFTTQLAGGDLPTAEQFSLGGEKAVRGVEEYNLRGTGGAVLNVEYRRNLSDAVQAVLFGDAGRSWGLSSSKAAAGVGVGVRIKTGMGIMRFDVAKSGSRPTQFIFGLGNSF